MLPMSLGLGDGGEQNAPLGRAVIGGLILATLFTLFFVPVVYSLLRRKDQFENIDPLLFEPDEYEVTDVAEVTGHENVTGRPDETAATQTNGHGRTSTRPVA
jgi:hypothetical protein